MLYLNYLIINLNNRNWEKVKFVMTTKIEALATELADKTAQEEAAFKASFAPLARYRFCAWNL